MALSAGTKLGPYEIVSALGAGGMGEVYQARDTRLDRLVAIKVLSEKVAATTGGASGSSARRAPWPPSTIRTSAASTTSATPPSHDYVDYLVMEDVDGQTLADRLLRGALPTADVWRYATELADALDHAHRRGLVHRDLKPGNVMLTGRVPNFSTSGSPSSSPVRI